MGRAILLLLGITFLALLGATPALAQDDGSLTPEQELVDRYSPILLLKEQDRPCDNDGEPYDAGPVELVLGDPAVVLRRNVPGQPVVITGPTAADLAGLDETYYLDFPGNPLRPGCTYEQASRERMRSLTPTAHAHIAREEGHDGFVIQYWLFYYYNDFNNKHEGDWEMVQVVFDANSVEEALQEEPIEVGFAQHLGGEWADWDDDKLEREDTHPVVYAARGSHASQFDSAVYLGWGENGTGFGCDNTTGPSVRVPLKAQLIPIDTDRENPSTWTSYGGHWGQRASWEINNGPLGPSAGKKWSSPMTWQENLRPASLAVPLSGALGPTPTNAFCEISAASADLLRLWFDQPWLAVGVLLLGLAIPVGLVALNWRTLAAALALYVRHIVVFLPAAGAVVVVGAVSSLLHWLVNVLTSTGPLADTASAWSTLTFLIGVTQHVVGLVVMAPAAIFAAAELHAGRRPHPLAALRHVRATLGAVLRALYRPYLFIAFLALLPIGGIVATYRTVQRLFIPHAVLLDDIDPVEARQASVRIVKGRWWRTAALTAVLAALVVIPGPLIGILLLVFAARSVEFVNLASSAIYALVYPFTFIATTLYYLDRRATS